MSDQQVGARAVTSKDELWERDPTDLIDFELGITSKKLRPEQRLQLRVLAQSFNDLSATSVKLRTETVAWFTMASSFRGDPFAFENVAESLGIDAGVVRGAALKIAARQRRDLGQRRRYGRINVVRR